MGRLRAVPGRRALSLAAPTALLLLAASPAAYAGESRIVVAVGNDAGLAGDVPLRYAEDDARRVAATLREVGKVRHEHLLLGANAARIQEELALARVQADALRARGERVTLVFYYSGHGDADFLRAGSSRLSWAKLKELLASVGADVGLNFIDACGSGGATLAKGASLGPAFELVSSGEWATGSAWLTSSGDAESSFESDELGGSFFSHYLVSALRGAADADEDGRVTLHELYQYAYQQTLRETSLRVRSVQHPAYQMDLRGKGDVVLAEISVSKASLVFSREMEGTFFISRRFGPQRSVAEVAKRLGTLTRMVVGEGELLVYRREPERLWMARVGARHGMEVVLSPDMFRARRYDEVVSKGGAVHLASWQAYAEVGAATPFLEGASLEPVARLGVVRRDFAWALAADLAYGQFGIAAVDTRIASRTAELNLRAELFRETRWATLSAGIGPALLLVYQRPEGTSERFTSLAPGATLAASVERRVAGPVALRAEAAGTAWVLKTQSASTLVKPSARIGIGLAVHFR